MLDAKGARKSRCSFCGASVGELSEATGEKVEAIYDCPRCMRSYCSQCSGSGDGIVVCLRCDSQMEEVVIAKTLDR